MELYQTQYFRLFAAVADATEALEKGRTAEAWETLIVAMRRAEEAVVSAED
ncbi:MAG: hypothetical protein K6G54_08545 [Oscillospiraceae bacterium]|nr:hypothetical protein [Oscillospiraceae bacterium]